MTWTDCFVRKFPCCNLTECTSHVTSLTSRTSSRFKQVYITGVSLRNIDETDSFTNFSQIADKLCSY